MTPQLTLPSKEKLFQVFETIIASPELSKKALASPATVFQEQGLTVPDPAAVDSQFFTLLPELKKHFLLGASGKPHTNALADCGGNPVCIACTTGMAVTATAAIAAALAGFPEDTPAIAALAELVGVSVEDITAILESTSDIGDIISKICDATGAC